MPQYAFELSSELCEAAESGNLLKVQRLVANGTDINERGFMNTTALMSAASKGHNHVVAWLMAQPQCDPNLLNAGGTNALSLAARSGNLKAVMDICEHPATNINLLGGQGGTALHNAAGFGHSKVVAYLLALPNNFRAGGIGDTPHQPRAGGVHTVHRRYIDTAQGAVFANAVAQAVGDPFDTG